MKDVSNLNSKKQIFWFDISVNDFLGMTVLQSLSQLSNILLGDTKTKVLRKKELFLIATSTKRHQFEWLFHIHLMTSSHQIFVAWSTLYTVHLSVQTPRSGTLLLNRRNIQKGAGCGDAYQDVTIKCCEYYNSSWKFLMY